MDPEIAATSRRSPSLAQQLSAVNSFPGFNEWLWICVQQAHQDMGRLNQHHSAGGFLFLAECNMVHGLCQKLREEYRPNIHGKISDVLGNSFPIMAKMCLDQSFAVTIYHH
jgi:hypothetical protein